MASIFTKIIAGEIPSYKLYEDEHVFAFLDIRPITPGHALVVPKQEINHILDVPEPYLSAVYRTVQRVGRAVQQVTGSPRIGTATVGFEVPHFHVHVVPIWGVNDIDFRKGKQAAPEELRAVQEKILAKLKT
jgi:histidine triad (HIT) family protein